MFGLGAGEIALVLIIALIFIGPKKLPDLAKGLGKGIRDFQDALKGETTETKIVTQVEDKKESKDISNDS